MMVVTGQEIAEKKKKKKGLRRQLEVREFSTEKSYVNWVFKVSAPTGFLSFL